MTTFRCLHRKTVTSIEVVVVCATPTFCCLYNKIVASIEVVVARATTTFHFYIAKLSEQLKFLSHVRQEIFIFIQQKSCNNLSCHHTCDENFSFLYSTTVATIEVVIAQATTNFCFYIAQMLQQLKLSSHRQRHIFVVYTTKLWQQLIFSSQLRRPIFI
jgi:hypothetical protein